MWVSCLFLFSSPRVGLKQSSNKHPCGIDAAKHVQPSAFRPVVLNLWGVIPLATFYLQNYLQYDS